MKTIETARPPLTIEKRIRVFRNSSVVIAIVISLSFTASSFTFLHESKGYAPVNGIRLYYEIYGTEGIPLVLIHGGGSTIETTFGTILPLLARHGKIIAVDLQSHGRSGDRQGATSFEQDADDVAGLLEYLKVEKANFFGFSNGGNTAMQIAIRHPALVNKLVVASSFYKREGLLPGFFEGMEKASLENMPEPLKKAYLQVAPDATHLQWMFEKDKNRMLQFKDWTEDALRSIGASTLLVIGNHDIVMPEHALAMSRIMPNAQLIILPGTHGSYLGEVCTAVEGSKIPEMTVEVVEEFLNKK